MIRRGITRAQQVLLAIEQMTAGERRSVSLEDLAVHLWEAEPNFFGLEGYWEYPDSGTVQEQIQLVLIPNEYVEHLGDRRFRLTDRGREECLYLGTPAPEVPRMIQNGKDALADARMASGNPVAVTRNGLRSAFHSDGSAELEPARAGCWLERQATRSVDSALGFLATGNPGDGWF